SRLAADENVVRSPQTGHVGHAAEVFLDLDGLESGFQVGQVVGGEEDVVGAEPARPEGTLKGGVPAASGGGPLAGDVEVGDADEAAGLEDGVGVVDGPEPVGDHRQRVGEGDQVDRAARGDVGGGVGGDGVDVVPAVPGDALLGDAQEGR